MLQRLENATNLGRCALVLSAVVALVGSGSGSASGEPVNDGIVPTAVYSPQCEAWTSSTSKTVALTTETTAIIWIAMGPWS